MEGVGAGAVSCADADVLFTNCVRFRCHNDVNGFEAVGAWGD